MRKVSRATVPRSHLLPQPEQQHLHQNEHIFAAAQQLHKVPYLTSRKKNTFGLTACINGSFDRRIPLIFKLRSKPIQYFSTALVLAEAWTAFSFLPWASTFPSSHLPFGLWSPSEVQMRVLHV